MATPAGTARNCPYSPGCVRKAIKEVKPGDIILVVDVVGSYLKRVGEGRLNFTLGYNYNRTRVDGGSSSVATNESQRIIFEERLPRQKATLSAAYDAAGWGALVRVRHYGAWTDSTGNATGDIFQRFGAIQFVDLAASNSASCAPA